MTGLQPNRSGLVARIHSPKGRRTPAPFLVIQASWMNTN